MTRWRNQLQRMTATAVCLAAMLVAAPTRARAQAVDQVVGPQARGLEVDDKTGLFVPADLIFRDDQGRKVRLGDLFTRKGPAGEEIEGKPTIIAMVYFTCPVVCPAVITTLTREVGRVEPQLIGRDFNVVFVSFDPRDTPQMAAAMRRESIADYERTRPWLTESPDQRAIAESGWMFYADAPESARVLANGIGFPYRQLDNGEYSHPIMFVVTTPDGRISRYIPGFGYDAKDLKLALIEASRGEIRQTLADRIMSFCYRFDPAIGQYTLSAIRVMQLAGLVTMLGVGGLIGVLLWGERLKRRAAADTAARTAGQSPKAFEPGAAIGPATAGGHT